MINKDKILSYINSPFMENDKSMNDIESLIEKYPYFQTAHLLFIKFLFEKDEYAFFSKELSKSAFIISDRNKLRELLEYKKQEKKEDLKFVGVELFEPEFNFPRQNHIVEEEIFDKNQGLIEHFLNNSDKKTDKNQKNLIYNIDEASLNSDIDNEEVVSETLAKIYVRQGKIDKAIKIYQQLCLKMPKKNRYFAAQIEKLKTENKL
ncbi:MAG: hypothetical protein LBP67_08925 [Bacteroidales bacterium]|jgi:hypothetical protein|nr:hypothetical protein [Bacteroidales bacterium]